MRLPLGSWHLRVLRSLACALVLSAPFASQADAAEGVASGSHRPGELVVLFRDADAPSRFFFADDEAAAAAAAAYRADPDVAAVATNDLIGIAAERVSPTDEFFTYQWYHERIRAPEAWRISQGSRTVTVAVLDTGVDTDHPDLRNNIWTNPREILDGLDNDGNGYPDDVNGWDFVDDVGDPQPHFQDGWTEGGANHGTIVAGLIGAVGDNMIGVAGTAWNVRIMPVRVLDSMGLGDVTTVVKGIDYAVRNGAQIVNLSLVGLDHNDVLEEAIARAHEAGVVIVAAAGNDSARQGGVDLDASPRYPACSDGGPGRNFVIGVAATDEVDVKASFSDYGTHCVDLAAPGVSIYSTKYHNITVAGFGDPYGGFWQGTSLAAPLVSGAAAIVKAMNPSLSNDQIRDLLMRTADRIDDQNPLYRGKLGAGRLNLYAAVKEVGASLPPDFVSRSYMGVGSPPGRSPEVRLFTRDGSYVRAFPAYAPTFTGGVVAAAGDLDGDLHDEIVTGPQGAGGPHIRVFDSAGVMKTEFFAFDVRMRFGVSIAVGDLDGDGKGEIAVAQAKGGSSQIRVWSGTGNMIAEFFAYAPTFRGGVQVAIGDIDGDGKNEIVTAPGPGGGPHIRVFDGKGNLKGQFFAGEKDDLRGWRIAVGDTQLQGSAGIAVLPATGVARTVDLYTGLGALYGVVDIATVADRFPFSLGDVAGKGRSYLLVSVPTAEGTSLSVYDTDGKERAYVLTYPKGQKVPPNPFVVRKP